MHVMIDLETLGIQPGCPVLSLGAVAFSAGGLSPVHFHEKISLEAALIFGSVPDASTLQWWSRQPGKQFADLLSTPNEQSMEEMLHKFEHWLNSLPGAESHLVWGNGVMFDNAILAEALRKARIAPSRWDINLGSRCYRTVKNLFPNIKIEPAGDTAHDALADAKRQARHLIRMLGQSL